MLKRLGKLLERLSNSSCKDTVYTNLIQESKSPNFIDSRTGNYLTTCMTQTKLNNKCCAEEKYHHHLIPYHFFFHLLPFTFFIDLILRIFPNNLSIIEEPP